MQAESRCRAGVKPQFLKVGLVQVVGLDTEGHHMTHLTDIFSDAQALLALGEEDVVPIALRLVKERAGGGKVHVSQLLEQVHGPPGQYEKGYPPDLKNRAERHLNGAWAWMQRRGLLIPEPGTNGQNGWHTLSDEAERIAAGADMAVFKQGAEFPKSLLHPSIADDVWKELLRGEYDNAVMKAYRAVEIAVKAAAPGAPKPFGDALMRYAFGAGGPLRDAGEDATEAEGLAHLYAGAMNRIRNAQAHRNVNISARAARELVVFASFLLYTVDERTKP